MNNLDSLAESIGQLYALQNADNDQRAVELYRAMFRNDKDINKLDFNYADHILVYVEFGCSNAEIDYKNYLNYLKAIEPSEYNEHLSMYEDAIRNRDDENYEEDE